MNKEKTKKIFHPILFYSTTDSRVNIEIFFENETIWLSQKQLSVLFDVDRTVITKHLKNIFVSGELDEKSNVQKMHFAHSDKPIQFYSLDAIISVGYRVNSVKATQFRIWATKILKEYIIKGFAMNDERLKNGKHFGKDYFRELLERIRSIRASERRIYQKITDIFAECSIDYDKNSQITKNFYATVQNKFHYAITGKTAAEIVYNGADKTLPNMGLKTWKNSPDGRILKSDIAVAKNYLTEKEIKKLERLISGYFDYIENLIERHITMTMEDLAQSINKFLEFNEYKVLDNQGIISHKQAEDKAFAEYEKFKKIQDKTYSSDFDKEVKKMLKKKKRRSG